MSLYDITIIIIEIIIQAQCNTIRLPRFPLGKYGFNCAEHTYVCNKL